MRYKGLAVALTLVNGMKQGASLQSQSQTSDSAFTGRVASQTASTVLTLNPGLSASHIRGILAARGFDSSR